MSLLTSVVILVLALWDGLFSLLYTPSNVSNLTNEKFCLFLVVAFFALVDSLDLVVFVVTGEVKIWRQGCVFRMLYLDAYCRFVLVLGGFLLERCGVCSIGLECVCPVLRGSRLTISCRNFRIRNSPWDSRATRRRQCQP